MISSKAGQRLARAKAAMDKLSDIDFQPEHGRFVYAGLAMTELEEAANDLADELIAGRHHEAEGD